MYVNKDEALEAATEMALDGRLPSADEFQSMLAVGVDYKAVHGILSEVFYNGTEFEEADSEPE